LKETPSNTWLTGLQRMPRTILPSIEQSYFIIAAKLLEQQLHRGGSILSIPTQTRAIGDEKSTPWKPAIWDSAIILDKVVACLSEHLPGSCAELVFNLDEVGISEWEDRAPRRVIVPVSITDQTIHHGVHHNLKHMSVICCV
jgi:hypothetical protein